jgi:hypothetical protein
MRKTLIVIMSVLFTGALLLYTAQANLDLLTRVSPNPQFVAFAMVALEGGVIYWTGYYLLHYNGVHKGIALFMIFADFVFSMVGFFVDTNMVAVSKGLGTSLASWFPHVILFVALDVVVNVFMGVMVHLIPDNRQITKEDFRPLVNGATKIREKASSLHNGHRND